MDEDEAVVEDEATQVTMAEAVDSVAQARDPGEVTCPQVTVTNVV